MQAEEACAFHRLGALGHVDDGLAAGIEFLLAGHGVLFHTKVGQLDADLRRVLDLRVKGMERQDILPADRGGFVTNAEHHFIDVGVECLLFGNKRHNGESPYIKNFAGIRPQARLRRIFCRNAAA